MSAFERRQANEDDMLWRPNIAILRQLYQDERKTLKEVKAIMENEKGFPVTPLPTWEVKLRELGIQKRLKAKDWSLIYQHVYPRLQHQGKKEFRKPTVVLIHGAKKPWDKCWKEIRRNRAMIQRRYQGPLPPLPNFITIRTPSPEQPETIISRQPRKPLHLLVQQLFQTTVVSIQPLLEIGVSALDEQSSTSTCPTADSVYKLCLRGIPFTTLLEESPGMLQSLFELFSSSMLNTAQGLMLSTHAVAGPGGSQLCDNQIIPSSGRPGKYAISGGNMQLKNQTSTISTRLLSEFTSSSSAGQQLGVNFDSNHYLSMVIYLLSNNFLSRSSSPQEVTLSDILQMTLEFVARDLLLALFQSQLLSIKASWERLLIGAQELKNKEAFEFLINIGVRNKWLEIHDKGHEYLYSAAQMNCPEILRALIDRGCQIASYPSWCRDSWESIIVETINNGSLDCAKLLIQNCDVNREFRMSHGNYKSTHFAMFIEAFDDTRLDHLNCLKFLVEEGADVDYEIPRPIPYTKQPNTIPSWWGAVQGELLKDWPVSILDYVYYYHRASFPELVAYSKTTAQFSRAMALWNLEQGVEALRQYLRFAQPWGGTAKYPTTDANILEQKNRCLEILLAEQFLVSTFLPDKTAIWSRLEALSKLEMDLVWVPKTEEPPIIMLYATACFATSGDGQYKQKGLQIMQWLLDKGLRVNAKALLAAYSHGGAASLQYLASFCDDIKTEGGKSLVEAVLRDDLSSANLLLDIGVDPNPSMIATQDWEVNVFEAAGCRSTLATMKHLVQRGVRPRIGISGDRPSLALVCLFVRRDIDIMFNKVQYIVDEHMMNHEPLWPSLPLLELCILHHDGQQDMRRKVFQFLWKKGAGINVGSPLAQWIGTGGGHSVVRQMLDAGADPNAYSFTTADPDHARPYGSSMTPLQAAAGIGDYTLICLLLEQGADLNAPVRCKGRFAYTALQAICAWDPVRQEERLRKGQIVQLLLDKGADANAANLVGYTALMETAELGDISTAFKLLKYGAGLNAMSNQGPWEGHHTALDIAAKFGRLDMVQFLLNANGLSSTAFSEGEDYNGAIESATHGGYLVISQLIQRHSAERHRWSVSCVTSLETSLDPKHTRQSQSLQTEKATPLRPQSRSQLNAFESPSSATVLDQTDDSSNEREQEAWLLSPPKAEAKGKSVAKMIDVSCTSSTEDIEDRVPLREAGCDEPRGARTDETADQDSQAEETISWSATEAWSYEPRGQSWVKEDQRSADLLAPSSLAEDVFMGFPGFQSS